MGRESHMSITKLHLKYFRNLSLAEMEFLPCGVNIICGENGSGKTSLLESICAISCGKSFRTSDLNQLIQSSASELVVYAEMLKANQSKFCVGISRSQESGFKAKLSGNPVKFSELTRLLPVRMISPVETSELINAGPDKRRSFFDWGVFHVKHDYWGLLQRFHKVLKQKSAALKARCSKEELREWNKQFCFLSLKIHHARKNYFYAWKKELDNILMLSPNKAFDQLDFNYYPGWDCVDHQINGACTGGKQHHEIELDEMLVALAKVEYKERELGYCSVGPHRADLILKQVERNALAKEHLSRGQQKLLAIAMYLAQGELLKKMSGAYPLYLIDDFTSELDKNSQELLIKMLRPHEKQIIITALDLEHQALKSLSKDQQTRVFSVGRGQVTAL